MAIYPTLEHLGFRVQKSDIPAVSINLFQIPEEEITNSVIFELNRLRENNGLPLKYVLKWICQMSGQKVTEKKDTVLRLNKKLKTILKRKTLLEKNKSRKDVSFLKESFHFEIEQNSKSEFNNEEKVPMSTECNGRVNEKLWTGSVISKPLVVENRRLRLLLKIKDSKSFIQTQKTKALEKKIHSQNNLITSLQLKIKSLSSRMMLDARRERKRLNEQIKYWTRKTKQERTQFETFRNEADQQKYNFTDEVDQLQREINNLKGRIDLIEIERSEMASRIEELESGVVKLTKPAGNGRYTYTSETDICIMELLDKHVPFDKVGPVIESVMKLCKIRPEQGNFPKKDYVAKVNTKKIALSQAQISEVSTMSQNQTLYSDETRKQGQPYAAFITTDENKKTYLLGLRQMSTKASKNQLDTFKNILADIEARKQSLMNNNQENTVSFEIMKNITSTMSDRAATQRLFNELLETYRTSLLRDHIEHYYDMSEEDQHLVTKMYNFFCGLHLLTNIADITDRVFKEWESNTIDGNDETENANTRRNESSGVERAVKTTCKVFGPSNDEKNVAFLEFKTYLRRMGETETYQIKQFIGNRFNIIFHNGGAVYYYLKHIITFLEDVKSEGNIKKLSHLLQSVLSDLKSTKIVQGLRALGIINKFITSPLWKLMEDRNTHILDMNTHYKDLICYLEDVAVHEDKAVLLITGEYVPFPTVNINKDAVWTALVTATDDDALCVSVIMMLCAAFAKAIKEKVKDHLEEGKFHEFDEEMKSKLNSVLPHNKLPEWAFGYLDWLIHHRPNSTRLANEAHLVFHLNKTSDWLKSKSESEVETLMEWAQREEKVIIRLEKERIEILKRDLERISKEKEEKSKAAKLKLNAERENLTHEILKYGLCKDSDSLDRMLTKIKTKKEQVEAVKCQIKFRQKVLQQTATKDVFQTSRYMGRPITLEQLKQNLIFLMANQQCEE